MKGININSESQNVSVRKIVKGDKEKWIVTINGESKKYNTYNSLPQKAKESLKRIEELKASNQRPSANSTTKIFIKNGKIEIEDNGSFQIYKSIDDVPKKYKNSINRALGKKAAINADSIVELSDISSNKPIKSQKLNIRISNPEGKTFININYDKLNIISKIIKVLLFLVIIYVILKLFKIY